MPANLRDSLQSAFAEKPLRTASISLPNTH